MIEPMNQDIIDLKDFTTTNKISNILIFCFVMTIISTVLIKTKMKVIEIIANSQ